MVKQVVFVLTLCVALFAQIATIELPKVATQPESLKLLSPADWQNWAQLVTPKLPQPKHPFQVYAAYDKDFLYMALEVPMDKAPHAGMGCGIPWHTEGVEFRFKAPAEYQLFLDAAGVPLVISRRKMSSAAPLKFKAHPTNNGYTLFVAFPWSELGSKTLPTKEAPVKLTLVPQWELWALHFDRYDLELSLAAGKKTVKPAKKANPLPPVLNLNPEKRIVNFGRPGYNVNEFLYHLPSILDYHPTTAIVMIGTNDVTWRRKLLPAETYESSLEKCLQAFQKEGTRVILVTMPPCIPEYVQEREKYNDEESAALNGKVNDFNARAKRLAQKYNCPVVDFHAQFTGDLNDKSSIMRNLANTNSKDGVHPTVEGYQILAKMVAETIRKNNFPIDRVACCGDSITYGSHMKGQGGTTGDTYPAVLRTLLFGE